MKDEKDLKQELLSSLSDAQVPEIKGNIKAIYLEREAAKRKKKQRRNWLLGIGIPVLAASTVLAIVLPMTLNQGGGGGGAGESDTPSGSVIGGGPVKREVAAMHQDIAYGAVSGGNFLSTESAMHVTTQSVGVLPKLSSSLPSEDDLKSSLERINPFMKTAEGMLDGTAHDFATELTYEEGTEFPYTLTVEVGYLKYRETLTDQDDDEKEFHIEGEYAYGDATYSMTGNRESEVSSSEAEYETEFLIRINEGEYLRIETEYESEQEGSATETEEEYTYTYYQNREETLKVTISYEKEGNEEEMLIKDETYGEEFRLHYVNESKMILTGGDDDDEGYTITVTISGSEYIYSSDGFSYSLPRV